LQKGFRSKDTGKSVQVFCKHNLDKILNNFLQNQNLKENTTCHINYQKWSVFVMP